jgi:hypothetical protein
LSPGANVSLGGIAILGGRKVDVSPRADGPQIRIVAHSLLGGLRVTDRP